MSPGQRCIVFFIMMALVTFQCKEKPLDDTPVSKPAVIKNDIEISREVPTETKPVKKDPKKNIPPKWTEITQDSTGVIIDLKYASKDNFTKQKIYECGRCFLRPEAATSLIAIQKDLNERYGFGLKIFDCYRPRPAQQRLWDIVPDPNYVTPPAKGSMHSKGLAVDLTIVDKDGKELNMGTAFDFFGEEAHHDYEGFSAEIQKNRVLIRKVMELHGFNAIRTEWWHYSMTKKSYPLADWEWPCN
jgi:zinc D-Ala-D-Ala dipeptidase